MALFHPNFPVLSPPAMSTPLKDLLSLPSSPTTAHTMSTVTTIAYPTPVTTTLSSPISTWSELSDITFAEPPSPSTQFLAAPPSSPTWGLLDTAPLAPWVSPIEAWVTIKVEKFSHKLPDTDPHLERLEEELGQAQLRAILDDPPVSIPWVEAGQRYEA